MQTVRNIPNLMISDNFRFTLSEGLIEVARLYQTNQEFRQKLTANSNLVLTLTDAGMDCQPFELELLEFYLSNRQAPGGIGYNVSLLETGLWLALNVSIDEQELERV
jgi:hypothetical protein